MDPAETTVLEYKRARDYERDARARRSAGWRVVSVLQRPGATFPRAETEYLVTYQRTSHPSHSPRPLEWLAFPLHPHLPQSRRTRWLWLLVAVLLLALLAYGLATFFADPL